MDESASGGMGSHRRLFLLPAFGVVPEHSWALAKGLVSGYYPHSGHDGASGAG